MRISLSPTVSWADRFLYMSALSCFCPIADPERVENFPLRWAKMLKMFFSVGCEHIHCGVCRSRPGDGKHRGVLRGPVILLLLLNLKWVSCTVLKGVDVDNLSVITSFRVQFWDDSPGGGDSCTVVFGNGGVGWSTGCRRMGFCSSPYSSCGQ